MIKRRVTILNLAVKKMRKMDSGDRKTEETMEKGLKVRRGMHTAFLYFR